MAAYRATLLEASRIASGMSDGDLAAAAALANTRGWMSNVSHVDHDRVGTIERALELVDPDESVTRAQLLALEAQELLYDRDHVRRHALASEAVSLVREAGDPRTILQVLHHAYYGLWSPDTFELRVSLCGDLLASARAAADPALDFWAHAISFNAHVESGNFEAARTALRSTGRAGR